MAAKTKINEYGDCVYTESDVLDLLYQNPDLDISKLHLDDTAKYMEALKQLGIDLPIMSSEPSHHIDIKEFDKSKTERWNMPTEYQSMDVKEWLLDKTQTEEERDRVLIEYALFEKKNFTKVLQFLIYFVDTLRANNIVWGVGRGSSVSSFCLFLIGVHKINPLEYDLDYREFLR